MKPATWLLSLAAILTFMARSAIADIDYSICNPLVRDNTTVPTPMPELAKSFTAQIEWKWLDTNQTLDVAEVQNGILNKGSQTLLREGILTKIIYDYQETQYIAYVQDTNQTLDVAEVQNGILNKGSQTLLREGILTKIIYDYQETQYIAYVQDTNQTLDVAEVQNGILNKGSQTLLREGILTKIIYDYQETQYIAYVQDTNKTLDVAEVQNGILNKGSQTLLREGILTKIIYDYQETQYIAYVEDTNQTLDVAEVQNGILNKGSQTLLREGILTKIIYDYQETQYIAYVQDTNKTLDVAEVQNGILNKGSQTLLREGILTKIIYDYQETQYIAYVQGKGCTVSGLGTFAIYDNKFWLQATSMLYNIAKRSEPVYKGLTSVRRTTVGLWRTCLDVYQYNITVEVDMYFSASGWGMSMSSAGQLVPIRVEMRGSQNSTSGYTTFHVIGDYVEFNPFPTLDNTDLQLPAGVFCNGRASRKPMNLLPQSFSLVMEYIDQDYHRVEYQYVWYDAVNRLIRWDTKQALNQDPDPRAEIFDFNLGVHYIIDKYMGNCEPISVLSYGDLFVMPMGNATRMTSALEFFHVKNSNYQYVGTRTTRGVDCDVWVGYFLDDTAGTNSTIEWYFTQNIWRTALGGVVQSDTLFRMDIWEGGSNRPKIYNILQLDKESPSMSAFDISPCYPAQHRVRVLLHFTVISITTNAKLSTVGKSYMNDQVHVQLTKTAMIPPLRITDLSVFVSGESDLYVDCILLDNAPVENKKIVPPPPPQHPLAGVLDFLHGSVLGGFKISLNSTSSVWPVVVQAKAIQEINYAERFTTTASPSTFSAATPSTPTPQAPPSPPPTPVVSPPTPYVTPPLTPPTLPPLTSQQTPCPRCPACTTASPCTTPPTSACPICPKTSPTTPCPVTPCPKLPNTNCPICPKPSPTTPCPTVTPPYHIPTAYHQTGNNNGGSGGLAGGVVAAIAIATLIVGLVLGVIFLRMYQRYMVATGAERKTILDNYLNDDERY